MGSFPQVLTLEPAAEQYDPQTSQVVFRGLRCCVGIYAGGIDRIAPHPKTGRADYFGQPPNRAARLMTAGHGGQVIIERGLMGQVLTIWRARANETLGSEADGHGYDSRASQAAGGGGGGGAEVLQTSTLLEASPANSCVGPPGGMPSTRRMLGAGLRGRQAARSCGGTIPGATTGFQHRLSGMRQDSSSNQQGLAMQDLRSARSFLAVGYSSRWAASWLSVGPNEISQQLWCTW